MQAAPNTAHEKLIEDIGSYWNHNRFVSSNDFTVRLFEKRAEQIRAVDRSTGLALLGIIYCVMGDRERTEEAFRDASRYSREPFVIGNWLSALVSLGLPGRGYEVFERYAQPSAGILSFLLPMAVNVGAIHMAHKYVSEAMIKLGMEFPPELVEKTTYLAKLAEHLELSDEAVKAHLDAAGTVLYRHGYALNQIAAIGDGEGALLYQFHVGHEADLFALNHELTVEQMSRGLDVRPEFDVVIAA